MSKTELRAELESTVERYSFREVLAELIEICYQHVRTERPVDDPHDRWSGLAHRMTQAEEWTRRYDL